MVEAIRTARQELRWKPGKELAHLHTRKEYWKVGRGVRMSEHDLERLLRGYEAGTRHPDVSGMEHLNLLQVRSRLAELEPDLTGEQHQRLTRADRALYRQAAEFLRAIEAIADLASWRAQEAVPVTHWWWYLDVISHLPVGALPSSRLEESLETVST
ncbi:MAG: hypothetical protein HY709_07125 [Candidatus Latescibacteria bacterium]|nr:hypothetical protein [Candidatus Latescibacterota bacterium]